MFCTKKTLLRRAFGIENSRKTKGLPTWTYGILGGVFCKTVPHDANQIWWNERYGRESHVNHSNIHRWNKAPNDLLYGKGHSKQQTHPHFLDCA